MLSISSIFEALKSKQTKGINLHEEKRKNRRKKNESDVTWTTNAKKTNVLAN
jgi:hypothetical protein